MSIRLAAAAKGLAVGVPTVCISVLGAFAYLNSRSGGCISTAPDVICDTGLTSFGLTVELVVVLFALMLALGPLLAWAFLLPRPALYLIPPFVGELVYVLVRYAGLPLEFLLVAPFAAYPVIAALSAGRRGKATRRGAPTG
jgi:hypothetical protein